MSTPIHDPSNDPSPGITFDSLDDAISKMEFRVQHAEPVVRDLNRHLIDLIGQCPNTPCGNWFTMGDDLAVTMHVDIADVLRLSTALRTLGREVDFGRLRSMLPSRKESALYVHGDLFSNEPGNPVHLPTGPRAGGINQSKGVK